MAFFTKLVMLAHLNKMGWPREKNKDLLEKTRDLMIHMNIPTHFWSQGVLTATYLINRLPSQVLEFKSPYEILKGRPIDLSHLRVFGCIRFVHIQTSHRDKLDPRVVKCIFMGYSSTKKGYKCFNPITNKVVVSRDVKFEEDSPYFTKDKSSCQGELLLDIFPLPIPSSEEYDSQPTIHAVTPTCPLTESLPEFSDQNDDSYASQDITGVHASQPHIRRNPSCTRQPLAKFIDYVTFDARYPISNAQTYRKCSLSHVAFLGAISMHREPSTFQEANMHQEW